MDYQYDLIIKDGLVVDGFGNPYFKADVGVADGKTVKIGRMDGSGQRNIDATGLIVAPGFIDVHNHAHNEVEGGILRVPLAENLVMQGITTVIVGNCGGSVFPVGDHLNAVEQRGVSINYGTLVGYNTIRAIAQKTCGKCSPKSLLPRMKELLVQAMREGAVGLSSGVHIVKEELIELCKIVAEYGGVYSTHMSDEGEGIFQALGDEIEIGEKSGVSVEISHIKVSRKPVWGKTRKVLGIIEDARARGIDITCDQYPYVAWYTGLTHISHDQHPHFRLLIGERMGQALQNNEMREEIQRRIREALDNIGGPEKILIAAPTSPLNEKYQGKTIKDIADEEGMDPVEAVTHVLSQGRACTVCSSMREEDVKDFMSHWAVMVATDGHVEIYGVGATHPRNYGTYPRVLGKYVREEKILTLEDAVRRMTSFPAQKFGLRNRGLLREGMFADITIFDPERVKDEGTYSNPHQYPRGIEYVIINGQLVVDRGKHTGTLAGKVLRRGLNFEKRDN